MGQRRYSKLLMLLLWLTAGLDVRMKQHWRAPARWCGLFKPPTMFTTSRPLLPKLQETIHYVNKIVFFASAPFADSLKADLSCTAAMTTSLRIFSNLSCLCVCVRASKMPLQKRT